MINVYYSLLTIHGRKYPKQREHFNKGKVWQPNINNNEIKNILQ